MKRENLKEATLTVKQIEETESQILKLETLIAKLSEEGDDGSTVELRTYTRLKELPTVSHIFTFSDMVEMSNFRKDRLVLKRSELLKKLNTL